jgi:hypothetical protein
MVQSFYRSPDNQIFYDWDEIASAWIKNENDFDTDFPSKPQDPGTSLAAHVVTNIFNLTLDPGSEYIGSYLPGYDVKNRDAYQIIQLSLADHLKEFKLYECYADGDGIVKFYPINENLSNIGPYILYEIDGVELQQKCENVVVVGYDPPLKKIIRPTGSQGYDLFTFARDRGNIEYLTDSESQYYDEEFTSNQGIYPRYWVLGDIIGPESCKYYKEGYIEFADPGINDEARLSSNGGGTSDDPGSVSVYDHKAFEKILGWLYKIEVPWFVQGSTQVELQNRSPKYVELRSFGELQQREWTDSDIYASQLCLTQDEADLTKGVYLPDSDNKKFLGVREVYIYGVELTSLDVDEKYDTDGKIVPGNNDFVATLNTLMKEPIRLSQGQDYIVVKDPNDSTGRYKIIFSCNVSPTYKEKFGGALTGIASANSSFRISSSCIYKYRSEEGGAAEVVLEPSCPRLDFFDDSSCTGYLKDNKSQVTSNTTYHAIIFPMGEGNSGYAMFDYDEEDGQYAKIIVVYDWDNPSVRVLDQEDRVTLENLQDISVEMFAVINKDLPPPIAHCFNGDSQMLDPREQIADLDPGTVENITETTYQQTMESLENGDVKVVLPFIACDGYPWEECQELMDVSEFIYNLQNHIVETTTYTCDPEADPILGEIIDGKVINSIDYSYQDSSQYFISVQAGPVWQGIGGWDSSVYQNKTERVQLEGVVRYVYPDNMKCLVQLERIGLLECVNGQLDKLETGDTVKVTVYNNPISV